MEQTVKRFRKRDAILTCLRQTVVHPSADWVFAQLKPEIPDLSLGTVYRNLALFKEQGLIMSLGTVNGVERFDGNTEPHVHFICTECGKVNAQCQSRSRHRLQGRPVSIVFYLPMPDMFESIKGDFL